MAVAFLSELEQVVQMVLATMANTEAFPTEAALADEDQEVVGVIYIAGSWRGAVSLHLPRETALPITAEFLGLPLENVSPVDLTEVVGELTNMIGGNFKSMLTPPCALSIPQVVMGGDFRRLTPAEAEIDRLGFLTPHGPLCVCVYSQP